ncbi:MAG: F0F1 ATP synthase subunit B [Eubacteriales bacterium]|nr:F0F1 ATP synthase subunit B [Eubacteriales bacterium]
MTSVMMFAPEMMANYASTAVFAIINLLVSYYILNRFLFQPIMKMLRKRQDEVAAVIQDADLRLREAEEKIATADLRLDQSSREAAELVSSARSQAEIQSESILQDARRESATRLTRADNEINRLRVAMLNNIRDEVADLSVSIASKVIGSAIDAKRQREMVDAFLDEEITKAQKTGSGAVAQSSQNQSGVT